MKKAVAARDRQNTGQYIHSLAAFTYTAVLPILPSPSVMFLQEFQAMQSILSVHCFLPIYYKPTLH